MDTSNLSECLTGTRTGLIHSIEAWALDPLIEQRAFWLYGPAGSGKSTISTTIANRFDELGCLGAFLFFERDVKERNQPSSVIKTLVYQLGLFDARIGRAVATAIETTPRITQSPLHRQFTRLLLGPLSSLPIIEKPIVIILDALDECGCAETRAALLALLATSSIHFPPFIRMIITSRAEFDIRKALGVQPHIIDRELDIAGDCNASDILTFIRNRMKEIRLKNDDLSLDYNWPGDAALVGLTERTAGLFIWASTACRFIDGHDPQKRLDVLLNRSVDSNADSALDHLYTTALKSVGMWDDSDFRADFCSIMGTILVAKNPLTESAIDALLSLDRPCRRTISRLGCILHWNNNMPIRLLHPSFADFLANHLRCKHEIWYLDPPLHNQHLAVHCLNHLKSVLKRNICNLTLSQAPVVATLPEATSYASEYWTEHVCATSAKAEQIVELLEQFLFKRLMHWLEAMSILKKSRTTVSLVRFLLNWLRVCL
jgi:hypothetical protein